MKVQIVLFDNKNSPEIVHIRTCVFVEEQEIDLELDFDGLDERATHVLVCSKNDAIGTGRLLNDGHIGRIAVLKESRGLGVGKSALLALIAEAKERNYARVYLGSQLHAVEFYKKFGFKTCGDVFVEAGIDHIEMELLL